MKHVCSSPRPQPHPAAPPTCRTKPRLRRVRLDRGAPLNSTSPSTCIAFCARAPATVSRLVLPLPLGPARAGRERAGEP